MTPKRGRLVESVYSDGCAALNPPTTRQREGGTRLECVQLRASRSTLRTSRAASFRGGSIHVPGTASRLSRAPHVTRVTNASLTSLMDGPREPQLQRADVCAARRRAQRAAGNLGASATPVNSGCRRIAGRSGVAFPRSPDKSAGSRWMRSWARLIAGAALAMTARWARDHRMAISGSRHWSAVCARLPLLRSCLRCRAVRCTVLARDARGCEHEPRGTSHDARAPGARLCRSSSLPVQDLVVVKSAELEAAGDGEALGRGVCANNYYFKNRATSASWRSSARPNRSPCGRAVARCRPGGRFVSGLEDAARMIPPGRAFTSEIEPGARTAAFGR